MPRFGGVFFGLHLYGILWENVFFNCGGEVMRPIHIENAKKAVDSLCANWGKELDSSYKDLRVLRDFFNCHITTIHQILIGVADGERYEGLRHLKNIKDTHYKDYLNEDLCEKVNKSNNNAEYDVGYLEGLKQAIQTIGGQNHE